METTFTFDNRNFALTCSDPYGKCVYKWGARRKKYIVTLTIDGSSTSFSFYDSQDNLYKELGERGFINALECFITDAMCVMNCTDLGDFTREYGFEAGLIAYNAYNACCKAMNFFESNNINVCDLREFIDNELI